MEYNYNCVSSFDCNCRPVYQFKSGDWILDSVYQFVAIIIVEPHVTYIIQNNVLIYKTPDRNVLWWFA